MLPLLLKQCCMPLKHFKAEQVKEFWHLIQMKIGLTLNYIFSFGNFIFWYNKTRPVSRWQLRNGLPVPIFQDEIRQVYRPGMVAQWFRALWSNSSRLAFKDPGSNPAWDYHIDCSINHKRNCCHTVFIGASKSLIGQTSNAVSLTCPPDPMKKQ